MGRALVRDPLLFLFDEPLSNLDAKLRVEMRMEIKRLHQRIGATIVYVTHDQIEAMTMATRIAVMHRGVVQQFADPDTVYRYPANLFVARFMGSPPMNTMPARLDADASGPVVVIGAGRPDEVRLRLGQYDAAAPLSAVTWWSGSGRNASPRAAACSPPIRPSSSTRRWRWSSRREPKRSCCCGLAASLRWRASRRTSAPHRAPPPVRARHASHLPVRPRDGATDRMTRTSYAGLRDRVVLITGGASGIGAAFVRAFAAQRGARRVPGSR